MIVKIFGRRMLKETVLIILIGFAIVADNTYLFERTTVDILTGYVFQITALIALVCLRKDSVERIGMVILPSYFFFIFYSFLVTAFMVVFYGETLSITRVVTIYGKLFFFFVLLLTLNPSNFSQRIIKFPMFVGLLFAIQSITLFFMIASGHPPTLTQAYTERIGWVKDYGIWGYGTALLAANTFYSVPRAQSFFGEPSKFALFLEYGIFMSLGFYKIKRKIQYLVLFLFCLVAFILSFSTAGYFAVIITGLLYLVHKMMKKAPGIFKWIFLGIGIVLIFVSILKITEGILNIYGNTKIGMALGKPPSATEHRLEVARSNLQILKKYPFGIGLVGHRASKIMEEENAETPASAPSLWLTQTGFIGLGTLLFILLYIYRRIIFYTITETKDITCYLGLAFVSQTIHHLIFGYWMDLMYLYIMALVINTYRYRKLWFEQ